MDESSSNDDLEKDTSAILVPKGDEKPLISNKDEPDTDTTSSVTTDGDEKLEGATAPSASGKPQLQLGDKEILINQIKGVLYGNCIGDAIGLLTEFMNKREAEKIYGSSLLMQNFGTTNLEYNQKRNDGHRRNWKNGDWTDDSDQMILILRTLVDNGGKFKKKDFARRLLFWADNGYPELGDTGGCGLGRTTCSVLSHDDFLKNPHKAARDVWEDSGRFVAPNGGVMRTSVLGTMKFRNLGKIIDNTKKACMVTHADPRCIASCVAVTTAIALMLQREHVLSNGEHDVEAIMKTAHSYAVKEIKTPQHKQELTHHMFADSLDKLQLDEQRAIGYTFKCMGAGFWAFRQNDFRKAIQAITMEAGDADTNCAVAGALLGCKVGFDKLPQSWVTGLHNRKWLDNEISRYLTVLGLQQQSIHV